MSDFRITCAWHPGASGKRIADTTTAELAVYAGGKCLTRNENVWTKTVHDTVLVSTYPLAMWFAASWWRLSWEPLPEQGARLPTDWRMSHEMAAANHGFVWPKILFASDGEVINILTEAAYTEGQSVNYIPALETPYWVPIDAFQHSLDQFINQVLGQLDAAGATGTELHTLWSFVTEDRNNPRADQLRRLEALLGFDPEECPNQAIEHALSLQSRIGYAAMAELAPVFGRRNDHTALDSVENLGSLKGMPGKPEVKRFPVPLNEPPWRRGVQAAKQLRNQMGNTADPINSRTLHELLGLSTEHVEKWTPPSRLHATVAVPGHHGQLNFIPRKKHPMAKRFELARLLGDYLQESPESNHWLTATDLSTSRQKYQRAFAAEFLCPISSLVRFLEDDFSGAAIEDAADHFNVSEKTIESLLMNNGYLPGSPMAAVFNR